VDDGEAFVRVSVTVPASRVAAICAGVLDELRRDRPIPGFRDSSRVPKDMVVKACGGPKAVRMAYVEACLGGTVEEVRVWGLGGRLEDRFGGAGKRTPLHPGRCDRRDR